MTKKMMYDAIFSRRSVRKYVLSPLPETTLENVKGFVDTLLPLNKEIKCEFVYLDMSDVKNPLPIKAPHYLCLFSEKKGEYLMNAGFLLQQVDLYLSASNLAACWLGMAKPVKQIVQEKGDMEFVIMLAFGESTEQIHREDRSLFRRKDYGQISSVTGGEELLEPVRLAPSASNSQPWYFSGNLNQIIVSRQKLNLLRAPLYGRMNQIDIGIALCHLWLSLLQQEKIMTIEVEEKGETQVPEGYEFMAKIKIG